MIATAATVAQIIATARMQRALSVCTFVFTIYVHVHTFYTNYTHRTTLQVVEHRQPNSGFKGGVLLKRNVFLSVNGRPVLPAELRCSGTLRLLRTVFHLVDCDASTRQWYAEHGESEKVLTGGVQGPPGESPTGLKEVLTVESATGLGSAAAAAAARAANVARLSVGTTATATGTDATARGYSASSRGVADHSGECTQQGLKFTWA
jgi:DUF1126 PH-like domain